MDGFAEKGTPDGWDLALGKVRGFRTWTMRLPIRSPASTCIGLRTSVCGWGRNMDYPAPVLPMLDQSYVEGMYGGHWKYTRQREGWYHASCTGANATGANVPSLESLPGKVKYGHRPPYPGCGCGYWAYWNTRDNADFENLIPWVKKYDYRGYEVVIPLSGVIDGSGATIIGDKGFRTERARITDLSMPVTGGCFYEEEITNHSYNSYSDPSRYWHNPYTPSYNSFQSFQRQEPLSITQFLSRELTVPEEAVQETIHWAVAASLGGNFKWHASLRDLVNSCPPDENYGGWHEQAL